MKELAIHCSIYIQSPDGWNEDDLDDDAYKALDAIRTASSLPGGWDFDFQIYDTNINDV